MATNSIRGGVFKAPEGWTWQCPCGASAAEHVKDRIAARDAYKLHRQTHKTSEEASTKEEAPPSVPQESSTTPKPEKETPVPTPKKKATKKKVAKKKVAKKVAKKKATKKTGDKSVYRIAFVKANKDDREVAREVSETGELRPRVAKRLGRKKVNKWTRVSAVDRDEAIRLVREGKGTEFTAKKGE